MLKNKAIIYNDNCDDATLAQIKALCSLDVYKDCKIRFMPDVHKGKYCPIGTTIELKDKVIPYTVGIDIGCGVTCIKFKKKIELEKLDKIIRENIPYGTNRQEKSPIGLNNSVSSTLSEELKCFNYISLDKALRSIGTLGGGNHFIELAKDDEGYYYLYVHTGSRYLGVQVADYYQKKAYDNIRESHPDVPFEFAWLEGQDMEDYINDVDILDWYASLNRDFIITTICKLMKIKYNDNDTIDISHNFIESITLKNGNVKNILRKGAISSEQDQCIIPINMKEGLLLITNPENLSEWNYSLPHGSGRKMAKNEVADNYTVNSYKKDMKGIYCSVINKETLEESPFAYRTKEELINQLENHGLKLKNYKVLKPIYNFKSDER